MRHAHRIGKQEKKGEQEVEWTKEDEYEGECQGISPNKEDLECENSTTVYKS